MKIFDSHVHTGYIHNTFCNPELIAGIIENEDAMALSSSLSGYNLGQRFANQETARLVQLSNKRVKGLVYFCPYDPECIADAEYCIKNGFVGIKLHPVGNFYDITLDNILKNNAKKLFNLKP